MPFQVARADVRFGSVNFWGHFLCSVEAEEADDAIDFAQSELLIEVNILSSRSCADTA